MRATHENRAGLAGGNALFIQHFRQGSMEQRNYKAVDLSNGTSAACHQRRWSC